MSGPPDPHAIPAATIEPDTPASPPLLSPGRTAAIGAIMVALGPVSLALYTPAMPALVAVFGTTIATVKLTMTVYFAGFAAAQLVCGPLSDAYGRRPVILAFLAVYLAASLVAVFAPSVEALLVARAFQGIGAAAGVAIARAIVRDLFTGQTAARIMNTIFLMLSLGPALAPTLGGLTMELAGWHAIFVFMAVYGVAVIVLAAAMLPETNASPDPARARPAGVAAAYGVLMADARFMLPATVLGASLGGLYAGMTMTPFVLMDRIGLTPTQFGAAMLAQSLSFGLGGFAVRKLLVRTDAERLVLPGLLIGSAGTLALAVLTRAMEPSLVTIMGPLALYAFSLALVMPGPSVAALAPFPTMAGAASALLGFMQIGGGLLGSLAAALFPDPVVAIGTILPALMAIGLGARLLTPAPKPTPE